jgi:Ca2+-binding EF-hand superfamily protein
MDSKTVAAIKKSFKEADADNSGKITKSEIVNALK